MINFEFFHFCDGIIGWKLQIGVKSIEIQAERKIR